MGMGLLVEQIRKINKLAGVQKSERTVLKEYFNNGPEMEGWGGLKFRSRTYKDEVMCELLNIMMEKHQISEKSFSLIDEAAICLQEWVDENTAVFDPLVKEFEENADRISLCAETCYSKFFKQSDLLSEQENDLLNEAKKSEFERFKDNKEPLTDEERKQVMDAEAVWHFSPGHKATPAVWKTKDTKGKTWYCSNTHRAWAKNRTLKAAINKFFSFVKTTA